MSRSPKKRKMKRSTSRKGIEAEPESKKSSTPRATTELNNPDTELYRPELASTSGEGTVVAPKIKDIPKEEDLNEATSVKEDSKGENCQDHDLRETAPVVIYNQEAVREIQNNQGGDI
ncbi:hypothetical protein Dimus_033785 [Dionaea muscipula]